LVFLGSVGCLRPPPKATGTLTAAASLATATPPALEKFTDIDAWSAVPLMSPGINIGNTLDNTTIWETGWGNPLITKEYVQALARLGFKTVRLPVAWDTFSLDGQISPDKMARVSEVTHWITDAGMFCAINIHWDGGWIDSDVKEKYPDTFHTFSPEAEKKFRSYWTQISTFFAGKSEKVIFEALNEETSFAASDPPDEKAYATLTRVNQIFIDTVRKTGGNNDKRLLIVTGYSTDITKTCAKPYKMPTDTVSKKLFISVHYYTPYQFCGLTADADWGKMMPTWGTPSDIKELDKLFDRMMEFSTRNDAPAFIGEFGVVIEKEPASRARWITAVAKASISRKMIPVYWDTGNDISRHPPYAPRDEMSQMLRDIGAGASVVKAK
jgi:endoglucanase